MVLSNSLLSPLAKSTADHHTRKFEGDNPILKEVNDLLESTDLTVTNFYNTAVATPPVSRNVEGGRGVLLTTHDDDPKRVALAPELDVPLLAYGERPSDVGLRIFFSKQLNPRRSRTAGSEPRG